VDASAILSIVISVIFAITGFYFAYISGIALAKIQAKLDAQVDSLKELLQQAHADYHDNVTNVMKMTMQMMVHKGEWSSEEEEELNVAIQEMRRHNFNPASVLSKQNKVGENEEHG